MVAHGVSAVWERIPHPIRYEFHHETLFTQLTTEEWYLIAPAGHSKTTLRKYLQQPEDADLRLLAQHLAQVLQAVLPILQVHHWQEASADASVKGLAQALAADLTHSTTNIDMTTSISASGSNLC